MEVGGKGEVKGKREEQEEKGEEERRRGRQKGEMEGRESGGDGCQIHVIGQEYNSSHHFQRQR